MIKQTILILAVTLLLASPALAQDKMKSGKTNDTTQMQKGDVALGFGSDTGEGPSNFFMLTWEALGYGSDTGEGPNTFFKLTWDRVSGRNDGPRSLSDWIRDMIQSYDPSAQPSGI